MYSLKFDNEWNLMKKAYIGLIFASIGNDLAVSDVIDCNTRV